MVETETEIEVEIEAEKEKRIEIERDDGAGAEVGAADIAVEVAAAVKTAHAKATGTKGTLARTPALVVEADDTDRGIGDEVIAVTAAHHRHRVGHRRREKRLEETRRP